ncbi:class II fructose-bisphosphate aldolase [Megasphaera sp.]|uniref:class II fructose-bisphosphate aldolase n=1 Tax=Megasphaera sp. TaxID=2023260 RepID=UPI0025837817|nr:class II fructose-bisphosphate aldolase [Megasphaera sp.]
MLTSAKEILTHAKEKKYGVVAPDLWDLNTGRDYVQIAEELNAPLILSFAEAHQHLISLEEAAVIGSYLASSVKTPISLHLDHGTDFEYIKKAISLGFNSVMIDASMYSFEENVRRTKEVVDYAHAHNVSVEAEIGHVGGTTETLAEQSSGESVYTTVEEAAAFIEQTKADSLAVSIGTSHGVYKNQKNPTLNFERLHELANTIPVPLVLHGGSGTGDDNLKKCIAGGITKVNVFTEFTTAALTGAQNAIAEGNLKSFMRVQELADIEVKKVLRHYIKLLTLKEI